MSELLKVVAGNTIPLLVRVYKVVDGGREALPLDEVKDLSLRMVRREDGQVVSLTPHLRNVNEIYVRLFDERVGNRFGFPLPAYGTWGIELRGVYGTYKIRSLELKRIRVVHHNGQSDVTFEEIDGEDVVTMDMTLQLFSGAAYIVDDEIVEGGKNPVVGGALYEAMRRHRETLQDAVDEAVELMDAMDAGERSREAAEDVRKDAESARENAERERQENEVQRQRDFVAAEAARQSTFEGDEAARQRDFSTAEAARQSTFEGGETQRQSTFTTNEASRQAAIDEKLAQVEAMEFDEVPTAGSIKAVKSGGIYEVKKELAERSDNLLKSMTNAIDTADIRVNISGLTITDGAVVVAPSSNQSKYYVRYFSHAFQKGDVIHRHSEASVSRTIKWGFTSISPADYIEEHGNLVGLELDNTGSSTGLVHEMNLCIPYDNAYFVMYYYNADWISGVTVDEFYPIHGLKGTLGTLRSDIDADHDTLENDVLKAIEEDYTNIGTWRSGGTTATYQGYSNIVTEDDVTTINIVKSASGGRFGIAFSTFPMGDYRIEFDYEIVNKSGVAVERIFSNFPYNAYNNSNSAADSRVSKYMSNYKDGHYVYRLKHLNTLGFYLAFTINNYFYTGDVMTVRNFKITKYDNDWKAVRDSVEENKSAVEGIVDSLVKAKAVGVNEITLTPSASETYLAYKTSSGSQFVGNGKRLLYFPKVVVAGGNAVTFRYTGRNTVDVYQLAEKGTVGIDDSPVGKYTVTEVMLAYKSCPSKESPYFDGNVDEDGNITVSFMAHKKCSRIAFVMGSTEDKSQTPTNISENILELHLPVYDNTKVDFSSFAKEDSLLALQEKVNANDVASLESPSYNTWKKYEMAADGTITYHSNSATYITYSYNRLFKKGDRVHFYGEHVNQSGRARRWGLSSVDPLTVTDLRELEIDVESLTVTVSSEIVYDDDGNYVKTIINQDITMESDGYLLTYNYNAAWLVRKATFYYVGALPATIEALAELAEGGGNISNDIQQSKFHSEADGMTTSLGLLHFSDIHGDSVAAAQVLKYFEKYGDYINDIVTTGDVVNYDVNTGSQITWWKNTGLAESSLFVLGNHDCATKTATEYDQVEAQSGGRAWNGMGRQWGHDTFFAPYFEDLGVVLPNGYDDPTSQHYKACYWHKDYETQKIRLIGLDCMNYFDGVLDENLNVVTPGFKNISNIGQEVWFAEKLAEAKTNGYSVMVMCHYPLDDTDTTPGVSHANVLDGNGCNTNADGGFVMNRLTGETTNFTLFMSNETVAIDADKRFCLRNRVGAGTFDPLNTWVNYTKGNTNNIGDILQRYIDGGGKFVAWLCGHYHTYHMFYPKKYPTVLNVVVGQAGNSRGGDWAYRPSSEPILRTLANYVSVDAEDGLIKFVRLGLTSNRRLRKVNYLCYDYVNKRVISEG